MSDRYKDLLQAHPPRGRIAVGEIEITSSPVADGEAKGHGIVYEDRHITVVRDPVTFPNFSAGTHLRVFEGSGLRERAAGVILPVRPSADGGFDVGFVRQWRHPLEAWATELPRGVFLDGEDPTAGILRELREETGLREPSLFVRMGEMANNSGLSATVSGFYLALFLGHARMMQREKNETEAISSVVWVSLADWQTALFQPGAPGRPVAPLDLFTAGALGLSHLAGHWDRLDRVVRRFYRGDLFRDERLSDLVRHTLERPPERVALRLTLVDGTDEVELQRMVPGLMRADEKLEGAVSLSPLELGWLLDLGCIARAELAL